METASKKVQRAKIGKDPVVVLPILFWKNINDKLEILEEYYEMANSENYKNDIASARKSKEKISSKELYKELGLV